VRRGGGGGGGGGGGPVRCEEGAPRQALAEVSVGSYNVLCSTYAVKWGEREGVGPDGLTNWALRWPVMQGYIGRAQWDLLCLQEVEHTDVGDISAGLGEEYQTFYFKHPSRPPDGVMIAVRSDTWENPKVLELQHKGVAFGLVDVTHRRSGRKVRLVTAHCRGRNKEQLEALANFADASGQGEPDVTVITGDFNEDFRSGDGQVRCAFPEGRAGHFKTLQREDGLPEVSRPPHKQAPGQTSGKGLIDWIWVRGHTSRCEVELFRDPASRLAMLSSHSVCSATGQWASDHGCEALSIRLFDTPKRGPRFLGKL